MLVNNDKLISNQIKRKNKRDRIRVRKLNGTYVHKKEGMVINKWGKPYYERVKVETPWKKGQGKNTKFSFWVNPITHQILENYDVVGTPDPHISYKYESTGPLVSKNS